MTGSEVAALGAVIVSAVSAIFLGLRNLRSDKFKHEVEQGAQLLAGYSNMVADLRAQNAQDRQAWQDREASLREQHAQELRDLHDRIDELGTQLWALKNRPLSTRERSTDRDR